MHKYLIVSAADSAVAATIRVVGEGMSKCNVSSQVARLHKAMPAVGTRKLCTMSVLSVVPPQSLNAPQSARTVWTDVRSLVLVTLLVLS